MKHYELNPNATDETPIDEMFIAVDDPEIDEHVRRAREPLSRDQLKHYGITKVTPDGRIMAGSMEVNQRTFKEVKGIKPYQVVTLGGRSFYVHRIVYAWFHGEATANMVIDHIDNKPKNNSIFNLQQVTSAENSRLKGDHSINKRIEQVYARPSLFTTVEEDVAYLMKQEMARVGYIASLIKERKAANEA